MKKISNDFWETVNPAYACLNELVVLPEVGDCGFMEYFDKKASAVISRKKIYSIVDSESTLMLEYPEPESQQSNIFELFFESPSVVAQNQKFEGLFGIDISNYVNRLNHDRFVSLISYINSNPDIVFVLFFYSDSKKEIERVHTSLMHHMDIVKTILPPPAPSQLLDYTMEGITNLCNSAEAGIENHLSTFYAKNRVGYDSADYLLRNLKLSGFKGSLKELQDMMATLNIQLADGDRYSGLGY